MLWSVDDMAKAMDARLQGDMPDCVTGISIDSRTIGPGEAYFAILGDVHDGHKFVAAAHGNGGAVSVVSADWVDRLEGETGPLMIVDDVLPALEKLGEAARARSKAKIIAVTGSVGKTTTKEALRTALAPSGTVHASDKSFNNHWGVPLTLARMPQQADFGVFEIGMNHPNEISPLVKMVRPHIAMITIVAAVHLGAFDSVDGIAKAKAEIFDGLEPDGHALINADDKRFDMQVAFARAKGISNIVSFGEAKTADARIEKLVEHGSCSCLTATVLGHDMVVKIGAPGRHIAQNVMAVLASCELAGADLAKAGLAMASLGAVKGRGQQHILQSPSGPYRLIDESYNANPTSMRAALALLAAAQVKARGRRIAVMGDMLELGPTSAQMHADLAEDIKKLGIDKVYLAGPEMKALHKRFTNSIHANTIDDLIAPIAQDLREGDVLMAKASFGMNFAKLIDHLLDIGASES
ncbi:MAG: UDP-N-acetylmuramoylalanyl-D-glutamyl-2,6-diaminopimelate--D-alanyl-D-alanine ligase [Ahrensia sp.]|nr:UDP-N-acetylmuramoylalanyl-D-glutamyl-2,6-diaminopimelate--D-alanyl-D-alanine ligase [Ahrensia sp.]